MDLKIINKIISDMLKKYGNQKVANIYIEWVKGENHLRIIFENGKNYRRKI